MNRIEKIEYIRFQYKNINDIQLMILKDWCSAQFADLGVGCYYITGCEASFQNPETAQKFKEYWLS